METETIDKLYLELSQITTAKTKRELELQEENKRLKIALKTSCSQEEKRLREENEQLREVYDHTYFDNPKQRYLHKIKQAILLLQKFSEIEGGGELAFGTAMMLEQFYKRAKVALTAPAANERSL